MLYLSQGWICSSIPSQLSVLCDSSVLQGAGHPKEALGVFISHAVILHDEASAANLQWALGWGPAGAAQEQPEGSISP